MDTTSLSASPRLFENPVLDKLSRVHHLVPLCLYLPAVLALVWDASRFLPPEIMAAFFCAGYVIWTLVEYFGHRFLFHLDVKSALGQRLHFLIHGVHHDHPSDPLRLVMPPLMSLPIMVTAFAVSRLLFGAAPGLPVMAGFIAGYLVYDMLHFYLHHGRPRTRLGRAFRWRHMHHHFRDETSCFGVSAPWWDAVFRTKPAHSPQDTA